MSPRNPSRLNTLFLLFALMTTALFNNAFAYPNEGDLPTPMASGFFNKLSDGYNPDGTLKTNPIIRFNNNATVTCGDSSCVQRTLQNANTSTISFNDKAYRMFINIPLYMQIQNAYLSLSPQYAADISSSDYANIPIPIPAKVNDGKVTTLDDTPTTSPYTGEDVYIITSNNTGNSDNYYIPNLPNSSNTTHNGYTEHVYWVNDKYLRTSSLITAPDFHLVGYGWADPSEDVNASIVLQPVGADGGSVCSSNAPPVLFQATQPFNFLYNLWNTAYGYQNLLNNIPATCPCTTTNNQNCYYLQALEDPDTQINPTWSEHGIYMPILAYPGFQRNLIRWYIPWGTWNQLNNTSDLYIRNSNGGVEVPAYQENSDWYAYPLVLQTWETNQFAALNLADDAIPLVVTNYPGNEAYFPSNIYIPNQAGLIPYFNENFKIYSNNGLTQRTLDGFLAFKGPSINDATVFWGGAVAGKTDPGGQANKPYLMGAAIYNISDQLQYQLRFQHSNSIFAAQAPSSLRNNVYKAEYHLDTGSGYTLIGTFSLEWKAWDINSEGKWIVSGDSDQGTFVPSFTLADDSFASSVIVSRATSFSSSRALTFSSEQYSEPVVNTLGGAVTYFTLTYTSLSASDKFLIVFKDTPETTDLKAATLTSAQAIPQSGGMVYANYSTPATGGSGFYQYTPSITSVNPPGEPFKVLSFRNNVSQSRYEMQVNKVIEPNSAKINVKVTDKETSEVSTSNTVIIGR